MKNLGLPLAEKTPIKNWPFDDLVLKDVPVPTFDVSTLTLTDNMVVVMDGHVVHEKVSEGIAVEVVTNPTLSAEHHRLLYTNNHQANSGIKVTVAKNVVSETPLSVVVISKEQSLVHQTVVVLETGAELEYVESYIAQAHLNANIVSRFIVGENAKLKASTISDMFKGSTVYHHKFSEVEANGVLELTNFMINDANMVFEDIVHLDGNASEAETKTVSIASGQQKQNLTIRIENVAARSIGNIINYGITKDTAHLAFNGIGKIQKDAKACDNQQETRLLNLSKTAEAVANPFLLIDEGDITAGHAASIGQLDEEQIYYLMSRGMRREEASKMIVSGFLTPFVDALEDDVMREELTARIEAKLG